MAFGPVPWREKNGLQNSPGNWGRNLGDSQKKTCGEFFIAVGSNFEKPGLLKDWAPKM